MAALPPLLSLLLAGAPAPGDTTAPEPDAEATGPGDATDAKPAEKEKPSPRESLAEQRGARRRAWWSVGLPLPPTARRFIVGVEGVLAQAPPLRPTIVHLDPRALGRTVAMGGFGVFGRYRAFPMVGIEATVRSGSLRYADGRDDSVVSQDNVLADVGVLMYLARGEVAQFAVDAGLGGMWSRIHYEPDDGPDGTHTLGSGLVRVGADAEFLVKRVAFVLSLRGLGVFTTPARAKASGGLFEGSSAAVRRAPVPALQTWLVASAGLGYRF